MDIRSVVLEEDAVLSPTSGVRADSLALAIGTQEFAPGQVMAPHYHRSYREVVVVQSGRITLEIDNTPLVLGPGDKCVIAIGSVHSVRNDTDHPAVLTYLKVPFDPDDTIPVEP